jgi:hypothetical protein
MNFKLTIKKLYYPNADGLETVTIDPVVNELKRLCPQINDSTKVNVSRMPRIEIAQPMFPEYNEEKTIRRKGLKAKFFRIIGEILDNEKILNKGYERELKIIRNYTKYYDFNSYGMMVSSGSVIFNVHIVSAYIPELDTLYIRTFNIAERQNEWGDGVVK